MFRLMILINKLIFSDKVTSTKQLPSLGFGSLKLFMHLVEVKAIE